MFVKLKNPHNITTYHPKNKIAEYGKQVDNKFYGITQYSIDDETSAKLLSIIPGKYRHLYYATLMTINSPFIIPHTDERSTSLNFYIKTPGAVTSFYREKYLGVPSTLSGNTKAKVYDESDLVLVSSFTATPGDIYLLNTQAIHGVSGISDNMRIACTVESFYISYKDTKEILKDLY
jgi:hypothetical protein